MQINNIFKMYGFIFILAMIQMIVNNTTRIYLDNIAIILVVILATEVYSLRMILLISLIADIISRWYLGSHLCATVLLSFITSYLYNFYKMSQEFQKYLILVVYYLIFHSVILGIEVLTNNVKFSIINGLIDIVILLPLINFVYNKVIIRNSVDLIY